MNNLELLAYAKRQFGQPNHYMYGTFGQIITQELINKKADQYPSYYNKARIAACVKAIGKRAFDCVGLIKFYYWNESIKNYNTPKGSDLSANGLYNAASVKGPIESIPRDAKGILVHMNGHIGIYDGNGGVYECTVSKNTYKIIHSVLDGRGWTDWCYCPFIDYIEEPKKEEPKKEEPKINLFNIGDRVEIIGRGNASSNGTRNPAGGIGWVRYITAIYEGKPFPYQVGNRGLTDGRNTTGFYKANALRKK